MTFRMTIMLSVAAIMVVTIALGHIGAAETLSKPASNDDSIELNATSHDSGQGELTTDGRVAWEHLSSANGDLPDPGTEQQTSAMILDIDNDGVNDFVVSSRHLAPAATWFRRENGGWTRYVIEDSVLPLEAGGAFHDIDGDGDLDIVVGEDASGNKVYWWENPSPDFDPEQPWTRRLIKNSGSNKHHDQVFGDFDGDGSTELALWNQGASRLLLAEIPDDPTNTEPWPITEIFAYSGGEMEGLAGGDIDGDGTEDIVGGGRWFEHTGGTNFTAHVIDDGMRFAAASVGQLVEGERPEVVFSAADLVGPLRWYEWANGDWAARDLLGHDIDHGHSVQVADIDDDGHFDVFAAEMRLNGGNEDAGTWIFYGDGSGNFTQSDVAVGVGNHGSKVGDLTGDGRLDILGKPYNWDTPRVDVWVNHGTVDELVRSLDLWERHVIDEAKPWRTLFITSSDINGDGHKDIITGGWWYENPGEPGASWPRHAIGDPLNNMAAVHDFDGDGHVDVLGTKGKGSESNAEFVWAHNDGSGNFTIHENIDTAEGTFLQGVAVEHFQSDQLGVALSWHNTEVGVQMLTVPDDPVTQTWAWERISETSQGEALSVGDIDRDGDLDLLLGSIWLRNDGDAWSTHMLHETSGEPDRNVLADINGDGRLDAVIGYEAISQVTDLAWYEQGTDPTQPWTEHVIANIVGPMSLDVRDMNNDGALDVVAGEHNLSNPSSANLFVYENADGTGGDWIDHVVHTGDEHHMGAKAFDIHNDQDLDVISTGWENQQLLLYENRALSTALNENPQPVEPSIPPPTDGRVVIGLQALYDFQEGGGQTVQDSSGVGTSLDLQIADTNAVEWGAGSLTLTSPTLIATDGPATKLIDAITGTDALTVEAWITPSTASQSGPARIVSMSDGLYNRNFTLGHGDPLGSAASRYDARLRTTATSSNGQPSISSPTGSASTQLSHLVYTRSASGAARLYLDGTEVARGSVSGDLSNWNDSYRLGFGNEFGADRAWQGTFHLVAFYDRALSVDEVSHNYGEGTGDESGEPPVEPDEVTWISPDEGATLEGQIDLVATAPQDTQRVVFASGDTEIAIDNDGPDANGNWSASWDTTTVADGPVELTAIAYDALEEGQILAQANRSFTVRNDAAGRIASGLVALYDFAEGDGATVHDVSGVGEALDLTIEDPGAATWGGGSLGLSEANRIVSSEPATKVIDALTSSNSVTVEAWITPASAAQSGPGRIVTISDGLFDRNLTMGHGSPTGGSAASYEVRLRTSATNANGHPSLTSPESSVTTSVQHVLYTRNEDGQARLYLDGEEVAAADITGTFDDWSSDYLLALGNEIGSDRPWLGTYHLVALYDRALSADEARVNFEAGPDAEVGEPPVEPEQVDWVQPDAGQTVNGVVDLVVVAPEGTQRVVFSAEGTEIGVDDDGPDQNEQWSVSWDTTTVVDGVHELSAVAYDAVAGGGALGQARQSVTVSNDETGRVTTGLLALYDFAEGSGGTVQDSSGAGDALDLTIEIPETVTWGNGTLALTEANRIASDGPAIKLIDATKTSGAVTLETWITPATASQSGPARVATISDGLFDRNLTLGHGDPLGGSRTGYEVRLRTTATSDNGTPSLSSPLDSATTDLQHLVFTRSSDGAVKIYLDGSEIAADSVSGDLSNWDDSYQLALGNEIGAERAWLGTYHLVALYERALTEAEIQVNFEAGPGD